MSEGRGDARRGVMVLRPRPREHRDSLPGVIGFTLRPRECLLPRSAGRPAHRSQSWLHSGSGPIRGGVSRATALAAQQCVVSEINCDCWFVNKGYRGAVLALAPSKVLSSGLQHASADLRRVSGADIARLRLQALSGTRLSTSRTYAPRVRAAKLRAGRPPNPAYKQLWSGAEDHDACSSHAIEQPTMRLYMMLCVVLTSNASTPHKTKRGGGPY